MRLIVFRKVLVFKSTSKMQYPNSVWWISQDLLTEMFIHRIFTYQYQSLKNIHFIVYPINCYIFANEKSCLTSKHMHIAEIRTVAKSLPLLRWNTHKSLILSYSANFSVILDEKQSLFGWKTAAFWGWNLQTFTLVFEWKVLFFLISINICRTFASGIRKLIFKAQIITT